MGDLAKQKFKQNELGLLHKNLAHPSIGINKYSWKSCPRNKSKIIGYLKGGKDSIAERVVRFIEKSAKDCPLRKKYSYFPGPNSNTFPQWIIDKFPECGWKLPWNAFGKNFLRIRFTLKKNKKNKK